MILGLTLGWIFGLIICLDDFFYHFSFDCDEHGLHNIYKTLKRLLKEIKRIPPHHFWSGMLIWIIFFSLDLFFR